MIQRNYLIINSDDESKIEWDILLDNPGILKYNYHKTRFIVEYIGPVLPEFTNNISYEGPYNNIEVISILNTEEWIIDSFDPRAMENINIDL